MTALLIAVLAMIAFYGLLTQRNLIKLIISLEILVKAVTLALMEAGHISGQFMFTQSLALTVIVVDTIVVVIALALAIQIRRRCGTLDIGELSTLRR